MAVASRGVGRRRDSGIDSPSGKVFPFVNSLVALHFGISKILLRGKKGNLSGCILCWFMKSHHQGLWFARIAWREFPFPALCGAALPSSWLRVSGAVFLALQDLSFPRVLILARGTPSAVSARPLAIAHGHRQQFVVVHVQQWFLFVMVTY